MAKEVIMPVFGFNQETSQIVSWLVKDGQRVEQGDPIAEVTTDKINMEIEAPASGVFNALGYGAGETVPVTTVIAYILAPGETAPAAPPKAAPTAHAPADAALADPAASTSAPAAQAPEVVAAPAYEASSYEAPAPDGRVAPVSDLAAKVANEHGVDLAEVRGSGVGGRITRKDVESYLGGSPATPPTDSDVKVRATPAARRVARQRNIALHAVRGSGPRGRVQAADVQSAQPSAAPRRAVAASKPGAVERIPFSQMRRTIADNLQRSAQEAPHIYFQTDVDITALNDMVAEANRKPAEGAPKVTLTAVLAKAVAWTLVRHPRLNSHLGKDEVLQFSDIHLGLAVALDEGLIVPVIHNAELKQVGELAAEVNDLAARARSGKLKPQDLQGATFTISNLGMFRIDRFTAIINPPQVGILAVGRASRRLLPDAQGQPVVRPVATLTLSVDHRVIDGAVAAAFLDDLSAVCERPHLMVL
ncbi:MAG TPA: 2-oxo acid dehydrogenase subunit E2 [Anaerolineales bacterium]|nr:2-oxo acid dehydrogenase subunit E2 [Anaerolineales bacterium]HRQ93349.1 2-oxo acid dehydrogenase subunit E2 [Anaerolineales bacterium]